MDPKKPRRPTDDIERPMGDQPDVIEPPGPVQKKPDVIQPTGEKKKVPDSRELK